jgi:hypothetical protein
VGGKRQNTKNIRKGLNMLNITDPKFPVIVRLLGSEPREQTDNWRYYFEYKGFEMMFKPFKDKIGIHVLQPKHNRESNTYSVDKDWNAATTVINVSENKTAEQIAADIKRRFDFVQLLNLRQQYADADTRHTMDVAEHIGIVNEIQKLTGIAPGWSKENMRASFSLYQDTPGRYGRINVEGTAVTIEVNSIRDPEVYRKIIAVL